MKIKNKISFLLLSFVFLSFFLLILIDTDLFKSSDHFLKIRGEQKFSDKIVLVSIDDISLKKLNQPWPWDRSIYTKALQNLLDEQAKVVGIDLLFTETKRPTSDSILNQVIQKNAARIVLAMNFYYQKNQEKIAGSTSTLQQVGLDLPIFESENGFVNLLCDNDNIIRQAKLHIRHLEKVYPSFPVLIAQKYLNQSLASFPDPFYINYHGSGSQYPQISFYQVLEYQFPKSFFKDKIVLIAPSFTASKDFHATPLSASLSGAEIFAHTIQTLLEGKIIHKLSPILSSMIFIFLFSLSLLFFIFPLSYPAKIIFQFSLSAAYYCLSIFFFILFDSIFPLDILLYLNLFFMILFISNLIKEIKTKTAIIDTFEQQKSQNKQSLFEKYQLSEREQEIVHWLLKGHSNPQIGKKLFISLHTVKFHLRNIYEKTQTGSRVELTKLLHQ